MCLPFLITALEISLLLLVCYYKFLPNYLHLFSHILFVQNLTSSPNIKTSSFSHLSQHKLSNKKSALYFYQIYYQILI